MKPPPWSGPRFALGMAMLAVIGLTVLSLQHPGLRLVDFLGFSTRAHRLLSGEDLVHPLYPVGYPAVLSVLQWAGVSPIAAGRVISVAAGALAVGVTTRWFGAAAGAWLLVQPVLLTYGTTEGTDLAALSLGLAALWARSTERPVLAGTLAGLATLTRYTSAALLPALLLPPLGARHGRRSTVRTVGAFVLATTPHWLVALITGASVLPDQSGNLAIGANAVVHGPGWDTIARLPAGLQAAAPFLFSGPGVGIGLAGLGVVGALAWRHREPALADPVLRLFSWGLIHWVLIAAAFANARLVLPSRLCFALGLGLALRQRPRLLLAASIAMGLWTIPPAWRPSDAEQRLSRVVDTLEHLEGPLRTGHFLTSDPWVYRQNGAHLQTGTPLRELGGDPRTIEATQLAAFARVRGYTLIVLDSGRLGRTYPGLLPLFEHDSSAEDVGLSPVARVPGYRVFAVQPEESP